MRIGEPHALSRQSIGLWCVDLAVRIERPQIANPQVIAQDVNNIGLGLRAARRRQGEQHCYAREESSDGAVAHGRQYTDDSRMRAAYPTIVVTVTLLASLGAQAGE